MSYTDPDHYKQNTTGIQPKDLYCYTNGNISALLKYIERAGKKHGESAVKDISKAKTYAGFMIEDIRHNRGGFGVHINAKPYLDVLCRMTKCVYRKSIYESLEWMCGCESSYDAVNYLENIIDALNLLLEEECK